ncbi:Abi-alpha family protein [uncultured Tateyamaria sp.]|uniref:Abi-alpha family protein n=1 Tax=uncultured Tateyamaria sp. TaxID=455651 RepID=UPI002616A356|nr:Abi-alpha family protein [uncultured Tateyamaria sp.]
MADRKSNGSEGRMSVPGEAVDQAVADVIRTILGRSGTGLADLGSSFFGGLVGDRMRQWRTRNLISTCEKTAKFLQEKGIDLKSARALPDGEIYLLFSGMAEAEDTTLRQMWSQLLASRMDPSQSEQLNPEIVSLLKIMTGDDAMVFEMTLKSAAILRRTRRLISQNDVGLLDWIAPNKPGINVVDEIELFRALRRLQELRAEYPESLALSGPVEKSLRLGLISEDLANGTEVDRTERVDEVSGEFRPSTFDLSKHLKRSKASAAGVYDLDHTALKYAVVQNHIGPNPVGYLWSTMTYPVTDWGLEVAGACFDVDWSVGD